MPGFGYDGAMRPLTDRERAEARALLPDLPPVPPPAQLPDEGGCWGDAVSTGGVWIPSSELTP